MQILLAFLSSILWGTTNPLLRRASFGIETVQADTFLVKLINQLKFLFTNPSYLIPFLLNQLGSVFFYIALTFSNLSLVVPITNSLTLIVTTITSLLLGEQVSDSRTLLGIGLVCVGIYFCVLSSLTH